MAAIPHFPVAALASVAGAAGMLAWRARETRRALTAGRILGPPLGMSTGLVMFALPAARVPVAWAAAAFLFGALVLAYPLQRSSSVTLQGSEVVLRRSRGFFAILLALLLLRVGLREYVGHILSAQQTASLFFLMAFGAILRWRAAMYVAYRRLRDEAVAAD